MAQSRCREMEVLTQVDVDRLYQEWLQAAKDAPCGGTPYVEACWKAFAKADDEVNGKPRGWLQVQP